MKEFYIVLALDESKKIFNDLGEEFEKFRDIIKLFKIIK